LYHSPNKVTATGRYNSVGKVTCYEPEGWGSIPGKGAILLHITTTKAGQPSLLFNEFRGLLSGIKRSKLKADHSFTSSSEFNNVSFIFIPSNPSRAWVAQSLKRLATGWGSGFDYRQGMRIFLFSTASRPALGPTQPPIQCVPEAVSPVIKRLGREADHSPPSSAEVKNAWSYISTPNTSSWICS
jgi:hypothetical protein